MSRILLPLLGSALCPSAIAEPAAGREGPLAEASISGTSDFEFRYYRDDRTLPDFPDEDHLFDYFEAVERLNLLADGGVWQVGAQADLLGIFWSHYYLDDQKVYEFDLHGDGVRFPAPAAYANVEKLWLTGRGERAEAQLGDGYVAFGRGLALNLVKNTDIDIDTSVRGAHARASLGMWDLAMVTGVTNAQQILQDNPNRQVRADKHHMVSGVRVDRYGLGPANVGAHGVLYSFNRAVEPTLSPFAAYGRPVDAVVGGANLELFGVGGVDWYLEGDVFHHRSQDLFPDSEARLGYTAYGSASFYPGKLTVLIEAKHYVNGERVNYLPSLDNFEVAVGPTLEYERVITEDSSAAVNSNDITGGRVRVDIAAKPGVLIPYVSLASFRDRDLGLLHFNTTPETIVHPVAGLEWFGEDLHLLLNGGYRLDMRDEGESGEDYGADQMAHVDASFGFPLGPAHGELDLAVQRFWWGVNLNQQHDFTIGTVALAGHFERGLSVILYSDYSDDPLIDSVGNIPLELERDGEPYRPLYGAAELQWQAFEGATFKAFYGAYRAGIRCAGGQCRLLPGFNGARLTATITF
ncbi:MAG: hypothetical protein H6739_17145 [Alphaproteobacteria bacterium]|nr:hypothetical protein [Alphaproteobacteria bacterium]